eukprot:3642458-Pleurochrysis_carterae.AAC.1
MTGEAPCRRGGGGGESDSGGDKLVESVLAGDLELGPVVKLLGGQAPDPALSRASTYSGEIEGGRWGAVTGLTAPADIRDGLGRLAELLGMAHVMAGKAERAPTPDFGMVDLTRRACVAEGGGIPLERGKGLIAEGFEVALAHPPQQLRGHLGAREVVVSAADLGVDGRHLRSSAPKLQR